ncbi:MAG TPA: gluconokinase [Chitinophagaceae bacterium]|jgi:gluconokinase|nr:gluconokinase [Chitinophagaceae bacterium]
MQAPYIIGIDIGTGSTKGLALDTQGQVIAEAQQFYSFPPTLPGRHEQDPEIIWEAFLRTLAEVVNRAGRPPAAISLSAAMHSIIPVDASGRPLAPMLTWADNRSASIAAALRQDPDAADLYTETGTPIHSMSPLTKLIWYREQEPQLFKKAARFLSIKEYIWFRLFGEYKVDESIASATGLLSIRTLSWSATALERIGLTADRLSEPVPSRYFRPWKPQPGIPLVLPEGLPVYIGSSDGCLAHIGSESLQPGTASLTLGTSGAVRFASPEPLPDTTSMLFSYRLTEGLFICGGPVNNGGQAGEWLIRQFCNRQADEEGYAFLFREAASVPPGSDGLFFLPYLQGERAPVWDEESRGLFYGITMHHRQAHFLRAGLEGVCYNLATIITALERNGGPIERLHVSGGFVRSPFWMQVLADCTGKSVCLLQTGDASALGAALLAGAAQGLFDSYRLPQSAHFRSVEPAPEHKELYARGRRFFERLYPAFQTLGTGPEN